MTQTVKILNNYLFKEVKKMNVTTRYFLAMISLGEKTFSFFHINTVFVCIFGFFNRLCRS
jgi:hypothetical protein